MDFDQTRLYYTHQQLQRNQEDQNGNEGGEGARANAGDAGENSAENVNLDAVRRHFKEFLSELLLAPPDHEITLRNCLRSYIFGIVTPAGYFLFLFTLFSFPTHPS